MSTDWVDLSMASDWSDWSTGARGSGASEQTLLSQSQYARARDVAAGDILLHFVLGVHCWSGYSTVLEPAKPLPELNSEWEKAYPYSMRVRRGTWLTSPGECVLTRSIAGLSHQNWHRKAYVRVDPTDAALIMEAVDEASGKLGNVDNAFLEKWNVQRDANASEHCKRNAGYQCALCKITDSAWCKDRSLEASVLRSNPTDLGWFFQAHHIKPVSDGGNADLDNLLCVCPNCHRMVQRLGETGLRALLSARGRR